MTLQRGWNNKSKLLVVSIHIHIHLFCCNSFFGSTRGITDGCLSVAGGRPYCSRGVREASYSRAALRRKVDFWIQYLALYMILLYASTKWALNYHFNCCNRRLSGHVGSMFATIPYINTKTFIYWSASKEKISSGCADFDYHQNIAVQSIAWKTYTTENECIGINWHEGDIVLAWESNATINEECVCLFAYRRRYCSWVCGAILFGRLEAQWHSCTDEFSQLVELKVWGLWDSAFVPFKVITSAHATTGVTIRKPKDSFHMIARFPLFS